MARILHVLVLVALVSAAAAACKNSNNVLRDPNSNYDPSTNLQTNAE